jgi:hypothetical protein
MAAYQDELTEEEKVILGEAEPTPTEEVKPEGTGTQEAGNAPVQETEKPAGEAAAETKIEPEALTEEEKKQAESTGFKVETDEKGRTYLVDEEGSKIPEKRFREIYRKYKEGETHKEKLDLIKQLGMDEFFKLYPDEAPQGYKPPDTKRTVTTPLPDGFNVLNLPVTGGTYDGMTLREVMQQDPEEGTRMLNEWKDAQQAEIRKQEETVFKTQQEQQTDAFNFGMARAKELFGIDDASKLTPDHNRKLVLLGHEVLAWQKENNLQSLGWEHAYKLMKHDELVEKARQEGASKTFKDLQKAGPASINTGAGGNDKPTGWEAISGMTEKELGKHIEGLSDKESAKFFKEAPASIKAKYPSMPWD